MHDVQCRVRFTGRLLDSGQNWQSPLRCSLFVLRYIRGISASSSMAFVVATRVNKQLVLLWVWILAIVIVAKDVATVLWSLDGPVFGSSPNCLFSLVRLPYIWI